MTTRDRRALIMGASFLVLAWIGLRGIPAGLRLVKGLQIAAQERAATLARARAVLATTPADHDSLVNVLSAIVALAPELVDGTTAADAQASLTAWVSATASRHRLKVLRIDPLPDSSAAVFGRVAVHGELEGDVRGLAHLLRAIETQNPLLSVSALSVDAGDPIGHRGAPESLHLEATIAGFYLPRGAAR